MSSEVTADVSSRGALCGGGAGWSGTNWGSLPSQPPRFLQVCYVLPAPQAEGSQGIERPVVLKGPARGKTEGLELEVFCMVFILPPLLSPQWRKLA